MSTGVDYSTLCTAIMLLFIMLLCILIFNVIRRSQRINKIHDRMKNIINMSYIDLSISNIK